MIDTAEWWPWVALALLGALHGINPGMGWLFAVARGLQLGERRAVWRALLPLALGHAAAIALAVAAAGALGLVLPTALVRWVVVVSLTLLGVRQLLRHRHPRFGGMRIGDGALAAWSFLVASAHGAGLMAVPFALEAGVRPSPPPLHAAALHDGASQAPAPPTSTVREAGLPSAAPPPHAHHGGAGTPTLSRGALMATLVHGLGYLLVTGVLAVVVYERAGTALLRRAWLNLDRLWAASLLLTAIALAAAGGGR